MPSYMHLIDFLKTRTNGDRTNSITTVTDRPPDQHNHQRQIALRSHTTHRTLACPACQGQHKIWKCDVFRSKSARNRLKTVKRASLCTNCLNKKHSLAYCPAGLCRICSQRHHTYLHQDQDYVKSRTSSDRSSNDQLSSESSGELSPLRSSIPCSPRRSKRSSASPRPSLRTSSKRESRSSRSKVTESNTSLSPQQQEKQ
jgi:hypothetical protein